jgi:hypothetical protein
MLWFFERDAESLQIETRYDNETAEFVAIVRQPDGQEQTARFKELEAFRSWLSAFQNIVTDDEWVRRDAPIILPDGWRRS